MAERGAVLSKAIPFSPKGVHFLKGPDRVDYRAAELKLYGLLFPFPHPSVHKPTYCKIRCVFTFMLIRKDLLFVQIYLKF